MREAQEEEHGGHVLAAFEHWRDKGQWPTLSPTAAFFVAERLEWAARIAELLATPPHAGSPRSAVPAFPMGTVARDAMLWLALEVYPRYSPRRLRRWSDERSDDFWRD